MAAEKVVAAGIVRAGVDVPDGTHVETVFPFDRISPVLQAEFEV